MLLLCKDVKYAFRSCAEQLKALLPQQYGSNKIVQLRVDWL